MQLLRQPLLYQSDTPADERAAGGQGKAADQFAGIADAVFQAPEPFLLRTDSREGFLLP